MANYTHCFAVLAYKESPYLEECLRSLFTQSRSTRVVICTSTPNAHIDALAKKYEIPLYVNTGERGIAQDWNFALTTTNTDLVTLAHQDDIYLPNFAAETIARFEKNADCVMSFTSYGELLDDKERSLNLTTLVKVVMLRLFFPFSHTIRSSCLKRAVFMFGTPISCPSVTFNRKLAPQFRFNTKFKVSLDWEAWVQLTEYPGAISWIAPRLMLHRIHEGSATTSAIRGSRRLKEDFKLFKKLWPKSLYRLMTRLYSMSYNSNH